MTAPVLAMDTTWNLGGVITINTTDANGVEWIEDGDGVEGWFDAPGEKLNQGEWPSDDGMWDGTSYVDSRMVTIPFCVNAPDRPTCDQALRTLAALGAGQRYTLTVVEPGLTTFATVRRAQKPTVSRITSTYAEVQIFLVAPDPRRYNVTSSTSSTTLALPASGGLDWVTGSGLPWTATTPLNWGTGGSDGTMTFTNGGTARTSPVFTIFGPTDSGNLLNPSITNSETGQIIAYQGTLFVGDRLVINTNRFARSVTLNGTTDQWSALSTSQWFSVPPGGQVKVQFQGNSSSLTPALAATVADAYF